MKTVLTFAFLVLFFCGFAQISMQTVEGLPTREVYDIHSDQKGYLWIAHELGISRFDGLNFQHFSHPGQASLAMSDIVEDGKGRIWVHNFSGQIFFIEGGKMQLLGAYDANKEFQFPRIALCRDELLATSDRGLFVCSTDNLKGVYHAVGSPQARGTTSMAVLRDKAVLLKNKQWYLYERGAALRKLNPDTAIQFSQENFVNLQPGAAGNILFAVSNPSGLVQMIALRGDSLLLQATLTMNDFVNGVSVGDRTWIHTRNKSTTLDGQLSIEDRSLTDVVKDKEGNTWFSSLKHGLLVSYKTPNWSLIKPPVLEKGDFVRCLNTADGYFLGGTNRGTLLLLDSSFNTASWQQRLFDGYGSIDFIRFYKDHRFVAGSSTNSYIINPVEKKVEHQLPISSVKDVDFDDNTLYLATSDGLHLMPYLASISLQDWLSQKQKQFPFLKQAQDLNYPYLVAVKRTRSIRYSRQSGSLFASFKDGLHQIDRQGIRPFLANGKRLFTSSMWYRHPRMFIATFNDGLWIQNGAKLRHISTANFLLSNTILRTKATKNHLWLFEDKAIQVLDIQTDSLLKNIELPGVNGPNVFDVAEWEGNGYLTTAEGIYKVPLVPGTQGTAPAGYLDAVIVNGRDTLQRSGAELPYHTNDVQFVFSSPAFFKPQAVSFRYRLVGADDEWKITQPGERLLRYPSLPPGQYLFEAYAFDEKGRDQVDVLRFRFSIHNPWWKQWWFIALLILATAALLYVFYQSRLQQVLRVENLRRGISSDLHDDIGATLSSITIYTDMARREKSNPEYLDLIQRYATEVINKLDDLVWSINPRNDSCEQLINRMRLHAQNLLAASGISFHFSHEPRLYQMRLNVFVKSNLYLLFKEAINNVVKHSGAGNCYVHVDYQNRQLVLTVTDDGRGFDPLQVKQDRNGLANMKERANKMRGRLDLVSAPGKGTMVKVVVPVRV